MIYKMFQDFYDTKENCINLKNPILLGILSGIIVYIYLYWSINKKKNKTKNKKKRKKIDIMMPITIAIVVWFFSTNYFDDKNEINIDNIRNNNIKDIISGNDLLSNDYNNVTDNISENSYKLIGKKNLNNINQDIFIDVPEW
jgi:hypothetical protein